MEFDYFYGQQAEQFSFYRIPKMLFTDDRFWNVSTDAKLLYGILLDRMNLSARNGWMDAAGRVYIIFTLEETMAALNCGDNKATKLYNELEKKCGLIERKRQGLGKPNLIYVKNFVSGVDSIVESRFKSRENHEEIILIRIIRVRWGFGIEISILLGICRLLVNAAKCKSVKAVALEITHLFGNV